MLELYREIYRGWNVKHFYEHLRRDHGFRWGYTWVKTQLHTAGLVERAKRRGAHRRKRERKRARGSSMTRKAILPQSPHHILIYDEDWEYLLSRFGPGGLRPVGVSQIIRAIIHQKIAALRAAEHDAADARGPRGTPVQ